MQKRNMFKIILAAVILILLVIVILQNTDPVELKLLFATIPMPRALLVFVTFVLGFILGLLVGGGMMRRRVKSEKTAT